MSFLYFSDNPTNLSFSEAVKNEVSDTYQRFLKLNGNPVIIKTPAVYREGLKFIIQNNTTSVLVPLDPDTIDALTVIEEFVMCHIDVQQYKPLWLKDSMYVNVSKWCKYEFINVQGIPSQLSDKMTLSSGLYSFEILVSHLYAGPHKNGKSFSLSLHVKTITYEPQSLNQQQPMELVESSASSSAVNESAVNESKKQSKKSARKQSKAIVDDKTDGKTALWKAACAKTKLQQ